MRWSYKKTDCLAKGRTGDSLFIRISKANIKTYLQFPFITFLFIHVIFYIVVPKLLPVFLTPGTVPAS
jgi:hypothetical protein